MMKDWEKEARKLYVEYGLSVSEVAVCVGKSRKSVSVFLNTLGDEMKSAKAARSVQRAEKRRENARERMRKARQQVSAVDVALLKRDHEIAVRVLSAERFFE